MAEEKGSNHNVKTDTLKMGEEIGNNHNVNDALEIASNHNVNDTDLDGLIEDQHWDEVYERFRSAPEHAQTMVNPSLGWRKLHWLCSMGASPSALIDLVASLYPEAITMPDNRYGDTPLHIVCRNSQTSAEKVSILLGYIHTGSNDGVLIRNRFGGTALHSASNHNAVIEVLELLVRTNRRILSVTTHDGIHAVTALWHSYMQTIPGYMSVANILSGAEVQQPGHFERFWRKVEFLATEYFLSTRARTTLVSQDSATERHRHVLHGLIHCSVPFNLYKVALIRNPELATTLDSDGNTPLHILLENRPFRLKEKEAIVALLEASPEAAFVSNNAGDVPLFIAIRNKIPWINGTGDIVGAATRLISRRDRGTGLYPFQLAAAIGGKVSVETTYHLISIKPDLLRCRD